MLPIYNPGFFRSGLRESIFPSEVSNGRLLTVTTFVVDIAILSLHLNLESASTHLESHLSKIKSGLKYWRKTYKNCCHLVISK